MAFDMPNVNPKRNHFFSEKSGNLHLRKVLETKISSYIDYSGFESAAQDIS
jgi:hypothetical protein